MRISLHTVGHVARGLAADGPTKQDVFGVCRVEFTLRVHVPIYQILWP